MDKYEIILTVSTSLLSIGIAAKLAISQYFKQREYELVLKRYLEGSVDLLAATLDEQFQNYKYNWSRAYVILKQFRDLKGNFDINKVDTNLREIECSKFNLVAQYRLDVIVGSQDLWAAYQLAFAFLQSANAFIADDFLAMLKIIDGKDIPDDKRKETVDSVAKKLNEQDDEYNKYVVILKYFHDIASLLEDKKLTFKTVKNLKRNSVVLQINSEIEETYKSELPEKIKSI